MKLLVAILIGAVLGVLSSRFIFVGSALSLIPWAVVGLAIGFWVGKVAAAMVHGATYGFFLSLAFLIAGYSGKAPFLSVAVLFLGLSLFGAVCGLVLGVLGALVRRLGTGRKSA